KWDVGGGQKYGEGRMKGCEFCHRTRRKVHGSDSPHARAARQQRLRSYRNETFCRNLGPGAVDCSGNDGHTPDVRRKDSRAIREIGAGMCGEGISYQNQSRAEQRCRRGAATPTDASILWMLRLAFLRAWSLAARKIVAHVPKCSVRRASARRAPEKS